MSDAESRFTWAREFCPHPEYWHSTDSESTEDEVTELVAAFVRALQPEFVLETGTAFGNTTLAIGEALFKNGHGHIVSLENNLSLYNEFLGRVRDMRFPITTIHINSLDYTPTEPIDFAFFDSWQEGRAEEFRRFRPWMKAGNIVAFHDTAPHHLVWSYVQSLEAEGLIKTINLHTPRGVCFAEVL